MMRSYFDKDLTKMKVEPSTAIVNQGPDMETNCNLKTSYFNPLFEKYQFKAIHLTEKWMRFQVSGFYIKYQSKYVNLQVFLQA